MLTSTTTHYISSVLTPKQVLNILCVIPKNGTPYTLAHRDCSIQEQSNQQKHCLSLTLQLVLQHTNSEVTLIWTALEAYAVFSLWLGMV